LSLFASGIAAAKIAGMIESTWHVVDDAKRRNGKRASSGLFSDETTAISFEDRCRVDMLRPLCCLRAAVHGEPTSAWNARASLWSSGHRNELPAACSACTIFICPPAALGNIIIDSCFCRDRRRGEPVSPVTMTVLIPMLFNSCSLSRIPV